MVTTFLTEAELQEFDAALDREREMCRRLERELDLKQEERSLEGKIRWLKGALSLYARESNDA